MPNKSDSAGKLHQFFTYTSLKDAFPKAESTSPLDDEEKLNEHRSQFDNDELESLKIIGLKSCQIIIQHYDKQIIKIFDVGESAGAGRINQTADIIVSHSNNCSESYSLKCAKSFTEVLSRNPGAKSLFTKYFNNQKLQQDFNLYLDNKLLNFLNSILNTNFETIPKARAHINENSKNRFNDKPRFNSYDDANELRDEFLKSIRRKAFLIIKEMNMESITKAVNLILDSGKNHILAQYKKDNEEAELDIIPKKTVNDDCKLEISGNDTFSIIYNDYLVKFRYKFESAITSSIKLVGSYKKI